MSAKLLLLSMPGVALWPSPGVYAASGPAVPCAPGRAEELHQHAAGRRSSMTAASSVRSGQATAGRGAGTALPCDAACCMRCSDSACVDPPRCNCLSSSCTRMHTALTPRPPHRSCKCGGAEVARGISSSSLLSSLSYSRLRTTARTRPCGCSSTEWALSLLQRSWALTTLPELAEPLKGLRCA